MAVATAFGLVGCDNILDVDNPNNVVEDELERPETAGAQARGVVASVTRGLEAILTPYSTASDELVWIGSREGYRQLDLGAVPDPANEFTDADLFWVAEARFLADEVIARLERFASADSLTDSTALTTAQLYGALTYVTIGDMFDDFAFSNRDEPAAPIGPANMFQAFDQAIVYLDRGLAVAQALGDTDRQWEILAMRARAKHARAVWDLLNPSGTTPANPLVNDAGAVADAQAALAIDAGDRRLQTAIPTEVANGTYPTGTGDYGISYNVNSRQENRFSDAYVIADAEGTFSFSPDQVPAQIRLVDPISNAPDPVLTSAIVTFVAGDLTAPITLVSNRELYLILAEAALAAGDIGGFTTYVNAVRAFNALPAFSGQIDPLELLRHERRVNLFLQGRRLSDMYRFGEQAAEWTVTALSFDALRCPGAFFPLTVTERQSNPMITEQPACGQ